MEINLFCDPRILTGEEKKRLAYLNARIPSLCQTFGPDLASLLVLHIQETLGKYALDSLTGFFNSFYYPAWTTVYYLALQRGLSEKQIDRALEGQAMAMFLHLLDDHLVDGEIQIDHMILALRSRAWQTYEHSLHEIGVPEDISRNSIHKYILAVSGDRKDFRTLDEYRAHFLHEASTWFAIPEFLSRPHHRRDQIIRMYEEFVLFWRLLDDLRDAEEDLERGDQTAFTILLDIEKDPFLARQALLQQTCEHLKIARDLAIETDLPEVASQLESFLHSLKQKSTRQYS